TAALGNSHEGGVYIDLGTGNLIGGVTTTAGTGAGNVISGNSSGIVLTATAPDNVVQGNLIGLAAGGTAALGNTIDGIGIGSSGNTIGSGGNHPLQPAVSYAVGAGTEDEVVGDFNADGRPDLAIVGGGSGRVSILLGNGDGTFRPATAFATG